MQQEQMTISLLVSIVVALIAGISAAVLAPLVTAAVTKTHWKRQIDFQTREKSFQLKYEVFQGAIDTLAAWAADALDPSLQNSKTTYKDLEQSVAMRPETARATERSRGLVSALFSVEVNGRFDAALRAKLSIENVPNTDFEEKRRDFVVSAAKELGLETRPDANHQVNAQPGQTRTGNQTKVEGGATVADNQSRTDGVLAARG